MARHKKKPNRYYVVYQHYITEDNQLSGKGRYLISTISETLPSAQIKVLENCYEELPTPAKADRTWLSLRDEYSLEIHTVELNLVDVF